MDSKPTRSGLMVYERLHYAIAHGVFEPGQQITERELADTLAVSRTPVREALHRLAQEGLIRGRSGRWRIAEIRPEDAEKLYDVRQLLEARAAELAAINGTEEDLRDMQDNLLQCEKMIRARDIHAVTEINNAFHALLTRASHNPYLHEVLALLSAKVSITMFLSLSQTNRPEEALKEHYDIFRAIERRDADLAGAVARRHSMHSLASVKQGIAIIDEKRRLLSKQ